jgi:hypothetical protein
MTTIFCLNFAYQIVRFSQILAWFGTIGQETYSRIGLRKTILKDFKLLKIKVVKNIINKINQV